MKEFKAGDKVAWICNNRLRYGVLKKEYKTVEAWTLVGLGYVLTRNLIHSPIAKIKDMLIEYSAQGFQKGVLKDFSQDFVLEFGEEVISILEGWEL